MVLGWGLRHLPSSCTLSCPGVTPCPRCTPAPAAAGSEGAAAPRGAWPAWGTPATPTVVLQLMAIVSWVRPANPSRDGAALGTVSRGKGTGPSGQGVVSVCGAGAAGDWLEMGQGNWGEGEIRLFLHLAGLPFASAHGWRFGSELGISGSSSHQILRHFTPGSYQQQRQC